MLNLIGAPRSRLALDLCETMENREAMRIVMRQFEADEESNFWNGETEVESYLTQFGFRAEGLGRMAQRGIPVWNLDKTSRLIS